MVEEIIIGAKRGLLTIIEHLGTIRGDTTVRCLCDCGNTKDVIYYQFRTGHVRSCGCLVIEARKNFRIRCPSTKHGYYHNELFHTWVGMITRCYKKTDVAYPDYGGRGIGVCDEWRADFINFYNWAINNGYKKGLTVDRFPNNDGNYEPFNCRWATKREQANNRRSTRYVELEGKRISMADACRVLNVKYKIVNQRINRDGLSFEDAIKNINV